MKLQSLKRARANIRPFPGVLLLTLPIVTAVVVVIAAPATVIPRHTMHGSHRPKTNTSNSLDDWRSWHVWKSKVEVQMEEDSIRRFLLQLKRDRVLLSNKH